MGEQEFQSKLDELVVNIGAMPESDREQLLKLAGETRDRHERMRKTITDLQDSLDYLRLSVKYLVFDLEATRRENQYLRKLIDRSSARGPEGTDQPEND